MSYPEVLLLHHFRIKMTKMNIFRAADQTWGSSVEILYLYTISHLLTYEKPHIKTISIVGHSDHHTDIVIELALKFDAICIYICTYSRNYHIRLLWSSNRYHDWIPTEIWCHLCTHSRNYHIRLVRSSNRYHCIRNLLEKPHLVIPIISMCAKKPKPANSR